MSSVYNLIVSQKTWKGDQLAIHLFAYKELLSLVKELDMNQIDEIMDVASICLKKDNELPSLDLLRVSAELLSLIEGKTEVFIGKKMIQKNWSVNFRIVIRRLLQTSAIVHPAPSTSKETCLGQYLPVLFELSDELVSLIGNQWFESDPDFLLLLSSLSSIRLQEIFHRQASIKEAFIHGRLHCHFVHCGEYASVLPDNKASILCGTLRESAIYTCQYYHNCEEISDDLKKVIISTFQFLCIYIDFGGLVTLPSEYTKNLGEVLLRLAVSCCEISLVPLECLAKVICELPNLPSTTLDRIMDALKKCNNKTNEEDVVRVLDTLHVQLHGKIAGRKFPSVSLRKVAELLQQIKTGQEYAKQ
uniref:Fanconi anemia group I protein n=1 Tax=Elaeophora elaphi TaxID=1147741 RepID=A0A0R3RLN6_9BILA